eukprot:TRINITY_DN4296_c0_g1_i1.p1 TRINITY_DN4296_c0_g1~~TRINITY_DN4296_c0_g1_i1.p1  ORF type:complete len:727 (+),score=184.14 TRINITY_DN4296_c0_g1_i1:1020-3200(+)
MDGTHVQFTRSPFPRRRLFTGISEVQPNNLTIGQLKYVERSLDSCAEYMAWVNVIDKKTGRPSAAGDESLVVVGKYRVLLFSRTALAKKKADVNVHLYELSRVVTFDENEVCLKFTKQDFTLQAPNLGDEVPPVLQDRVRRIAVNFPPHLTPSFAYHPPERAFELPPLELGFDKGFLETYRASCCYYNLLSSTSFVNYVLSLATSDQSSSWSKSHGHGRLFRLEFHECAGIEPKSDLTFDLLPVAFALRFAACFYAVSMKLVPRKDFISALSIALQHNVSITKLTLCATSSEPSGFVELGNALRENVANHITHLELERSELRDVGAAALAQAIASKKTGLVALILRDCGIQARGMAAIFRALHTNQTVSASLACLDVSDNECGSLATGSFSDWLYGFRVDAIRPTSCSSSLKRICLASCQLDTREALQAIRASLLNRLRHFDLSRNRFSKDAVPGLLEFIGQSTALVDLSLVGCHVSAELVESLLVALRSNQGIRAVKLNLSDNELGASGARLIAKEMRVLHNLRTLRLAGCELRSDGMLEIIKAAAASKTIVGLDLSDNARSKVEPIIAALCELVAADSGVRKLRLARNGFGEAGLQFLSKLSGNTQLEVLDVSSNRLGNQAAVLLAGFVAANKVISKIGWDDNDIQLAGWQTFAEALRLNDSLCEMAEPMKDISRVVSGQKNREQVMKVMQRISQSLKENRARRQPVVKSPKTKRQHTRRPSLI